MVARNTQSSEINVVVSGTNWAWPEALKYLFRPRDINLLVAESANEFVELLKCQRIQTAIVDMESESVALATVKIIRMDYPVLPCIMLAGDAGKEVLSKALELDVFSVIEKPVDMELLRKQLNRLFVKKYSSYIFQRKIGGCSNRS